MQAACDISVLAMDKEATCCLGGSITLTQTGAFDCLLAKPMDGCFVGLSSRKAAGNPCKPPCASMLPAESLLGRRVGKFPRSHLLPCMGGIRYHQATDTRI